MSREMVGGPLYSLAGLEGGGGRGYFVAAVAAAATAWLGVNETARRHDKANTAASSKAGKSSGLRGTNGRVSGSLCTSSDVCQ